MGAVYLGGAALRTAYVATLGESVDVASLQKALALDPANPELHHRLGMLLCDSLAAATRSEGLKQLRLAIDLDPHAARYWSDLALVCEMAGDTACATHSIEQALEVSPMTPQLHWMAGNTFLRAGQTDAAMAEFRRLLAMDPSYAPATFHVCLGSLGDPGLILQRVLPPGKDPRVRLAYLNFLIANGLADQANRVWGEAVKSSNSFPLSFAKPYLDYLLAAGRFENARGAWQDLEKLGIISSPGPDQDGNLVFNGDFEQKPLNVGFDWRIQADPYIALDFADPTSHSGKYCVRIDFTVSRNEEYTPLFQLVPVASNEAYLLTSYVRSQDITSDSGPRLRVVDPVRQRDPNIMSETTVGTTPWHLVSVKFCTGTDTKIVLLSVTRIRSRTFPMEITGSFWLDTVVLKSLGPASENACPVSGS